MCRVKDFEQHWRLRGVKVVSSSEGFVELHLTTHVPICQNANSEYKERLVEHELQLKLDPNTMALEDAQVHLTVHSSYCPTSLIQTI